MGNTTSAPSIASMAGFEDTSPGNEPVARAAAELAHIRMYLTGIDAVGTERLNNLEHTIKSLDASFREQSVRLNKLDKNIAELLRLRQSEVEQRERGLMAMGLGAKTIDEFLEKRVDVVADRHLRENFRRRARSNEPNDGQLAIKDLSAGDKGAAPRGGV